MDCPINVYNEKKLKFDDDLYWKKRIEKYLKKVFRQLGLD